MAKLSVPPQMIAVCLGEPLGKWHSAHVADPYTGADLQLRMNEQTDRVAREKLWAFGLIVASVDPCDPPLRDPELDEHRNHIRSQIQDAIRDDVGKSNRDQKEAIDWMNTLLGQRPTGIAARVEQDGPFDADSRARLHDAARHESHPVDRHYLLNSIMRAYWHQHSTTRRSGPLRLCEATGWQWLVELDAYRLAVWVGEKRIVKAKDADTGEFDILHDFADAVEALGFDQRAEDIRSLGLLALDGKWADRLTPQDG
ncbi:MAG: hypothetical protein IT436_12370 [Phycisphaerales bacterium]|nr:hypothetical protein [Phycisphaerales bacterium]